MDKKPRKNPDITIRLTPGERRAIDRAAEDDHLSSSTWIRRLALFGAEDRSSRDTERARVAGLTARVRGGAGGRRKGRKR